MKDLLEHIVKSIVNNPEEVVIEEKESVDFPGLIILSISVAEDDKGVVIGRKGRTINAIRDIMTIHAIRTDKRIRVLLDEGEEQGRRPRREEREQEPKVDTTVSAEVEDMLEDEI